MENVSIEETYEREESCKSRKCFLIALLTTIFAVVLIAIIALVIVLLQPQTPQKGSTTVSTTTGVNTVTNLITNKATATEVPLVTTAVRAEVPSKSESSPAAVQEPEPIIYFATEGGGLKVYAMETFETKTAVIKNESFRGVMYDFHRHFVYWSSMYQIYRKPVSGSQVMTVLNTTEYGSIQALDFDWVTTNIYVATYGGRILACDARMKLALNCVSLVTGQRYARGIALDPIQGLMFWTSYYSDDGSVSRAGMDGSDPSVVVPGLAFPTGIAIDFENSRLYWVATVSNSIQSSNLEGTDIQTVKRFPRGSVTYGLAFHAGRIYCTNHKSKTLESFTTDGQEIHVLHKDTNLLFHLAIASSRLDLPRNRTNHCEGQQCSKVCVLTRTSFRCVF